MGWRNKPVLSEPLWINAFHLEETTAATAIAWKC